MDDTKAFEALVVRYQGQVCAVAFSVLRDRARSEEVAQEAFLIAWQKLPAMHPRPQLPGWVCGIARNLALNTARRKKESPMETTTEPATHSTALDHLLDAEREQLAARALADLSDHDRDAVVCYYRGEGSMADVASTLGITETAARQRVHRGRERLRSALAAVEASLRATRPGHAFTAACVAALAAGGATSAAAAAAASEMSNPPATSTPASGTSSVTKASKAWLALPVAAALIAAGAAVVGQSSSESSPSSTFGSAPRAAGKLSDASGGRRRDSAYVRRIDGATRSALLGRLRDARRTRAGSAAPAAETASLRTEPAKVYDFSGGTLIDTSKPPPDPSKLDKRSIRYAIQDTGPLLLECYGAAFDRLARKDGTLEVKLVLVGEPGLATIVDDVELGGDSHLTKDAAFAECVRETLLSIELPAMTAPETWNVHYPLTMPGRR